MSGRTWLIRILMVFGAIAAAIVALGALFWQQATALPEWYRAPVRVSDQLEPSDRPTVEQQVATLQERVRAQLRQPLGSPVELRLTADELSMVLAHEILRTRPADNPVRGVHFTVDRDYVWGSLVLDLQQLSQTQMAPDERAMLQRVLPVIPGGNQKNIAITVRGRPQVRDGYLTVGRDLKIKVGNVDLTLGAIANQLGTSEVTLQNAINRGLRFPRVRISTVSLADDTITIRGTVN